MQHHVRLDLQMADFSNLASEKTRERQREALLSIVHTPHSHLFSASLPEGGCPVIYPTQFHPQACSLPRKLNEAILTVKIRRINWKSPKKSYYFRQNNEKPTKVRTSDSLSTLDLCAVFYVFLTCVKCGTFLRKKFVERVFKASPSTRLLIAKPVILWPNV